MGLIVWLPLMGTLNNQGTRNILVENMGSVTSNDEGKIGKCMAFAGTTASTIRLPAILNASDEFSIAFWVKINDTTVSSCLYSQRVETNKTGFTIFYLNNTGIRFDEGASVQSSLNFTPGKWYHVVCCRDTTTTYVYINGVLSVTGTRTNTSAAKVNTNYSYIGGSQNTTAGTPVQDTMNLFSGYLNDYRIYDHCLSAAEVHEISQGLVLHYKLNNLTNPNLLTGNVNTLGVITLNQCTAVIDDGGIKATINSASGDRRFYYSVSNVWTPANSTFTVSFEAKAATDGLELNVSRSNITTDMIHFNLTTEWRHYSGQIVNTAAADGGTLSFQCLTNDSTFWIKNAKLERGAIETRFVFAGETDIKIIDSSGYNRNGTSTDILLSSDTIRYNASTVFNGTTSTITITNQDLNKILNNACTISFWKKSISEDGARSIYFSSYNGSPFWCLEKTANNQLRYDWNDSIDKYSANNLLMDNSWQHIGFVREGTAKANFYLNGVLQTEFTTATTDLSALVDIWRIGRDTRTNNGTPYHGYISDFRIYCTALSAADIKALYEVGAKIDNKGNLHTYELKEDNTNQLLKTGVFKNPLYIEEYKLVQNRGWSYTSSGGNNSCAGSIMVDLSAFVELHRSIVLTIEGDISWINITPNGEGTFAARFQGNNRKLDGTWAWAGTNYAHPGTNQTSAMTAKATDTQHFKIVRTIPTSWFDTYNASNVSYRTDYATGTITLSNFSVTVTFANAQIGTTVTAGKNLIEF